MLCKVTLFSIDYLKECAPDGNQPGITFTKCEFYQKLSKEKKNWKYLKLKLHFKMR